MLKHFKFREFKKVGGITEISNINNNPVFKIKLAKKFYNGLFERPTQNIFSHLSIIISIDTIENLKFTFDISWALSIAITSAGIRLLQIPTYWLIKDIKYEKFVPNFIIKFLRKWHHKLILNDLYIDMKRNKLNQIEKENVSNYYEINLIISWLTQFFLLFNNFKGLCSISKEGDLYPGFNNDLFGMNLALYDAGFLLPIIVFINNFLFLKISNHPWLINYTKNSLNNYSKLIYLSFFMSMFSVFWPKCYAISWISYCVTHMVIKKLSDHLIQIKDKNRNYSVYVDRIYKKKIEDFYNKN